MLSVLYHEEYYQEKLLNHASKYRDYQTLPLYIYIIQANCILYTIQARFCGASDRVYFTASSDLITYDLTVMEITSACSTARSL